MHAIVPWYVSNYWFIQGKRFKGWNIFYGPLFAMIYVPYTCLCVVTCDVAACELYKHSAWCYDEILDNDRTSS